MDNICRTCMQNVQMSHPISDKILINNESLTILDVLVLCASIQINETDGLPQVICDKCQNEATSTYLFRKMCQNSDKLLKKVQSNGPATEYLKLNNGTDFREEASHNKKLQNSLLDNHQHTNINNFKCNKCKEKFTTKKHLHKHRKCHRNGVKILEQYPVEKRTCPQCGKTFQYRSSMLKHIKIHNAPPKTCSYCDYLPPTPNQLSKHMEKTHASLKNFSCLTCGKTFFKETNLKLHLIVHSGVKKHTCEMCGMSFALAGNLAAHRRLHTGEKPYTCSHCGRGFTQQSALRSHEAGHSDRRDHICPDCGAAFSRPGALRNHQKRHSNERPFACSMCGQAFTFSSELKRHMSIHTGDKNHTCEVCGRSFNRSTNLKVHKRIHTGETPHVCSVCGKGFIQAHCLRTHMNTHAACGT